MDNFEELVKAFKKEEMKTKHAQRKAEKLKLRKTRSVKQGIVNSRDMVVRGLKQEIQRDFRRFKRNFSNFTYLSNNFFIKIFSGV